MPPPTHEVWLAPHLVPGQGELKELKRKLDTADKKRKELESRKERARSAGELSDAQLGRKKEIAKEIAGVEKEIVKPKAAVEAQDEKIEKLQQEIYQLGGVQLQVQKAKVDSKKDLLKIKESELAKVSAT